MLFTKLAAMLTTLFAVLLLDHFHMRCVFYQNYVSKVASPPISPMWNRDSESRHVVVPGVLRMAPGSPIPTVTQDNEGQGRRLNPALTRIEALLFKESDVPLLFS